MNAILREITEVMLATEYRTPYDINDGGCEDWANRVMARLHDTPHDVQIWATPFGLADTNHIFLRIDGKFYDAECLGGCVDHMELPIFAKIGTRQPVWLEDHNERAVITEDKRDMTDAQVEQYHHDNGNP